MHLSHKNRVRVLHTLGPTGTNCEAAAYAWFDRNGISGDVRLFSTLEDGARALPDDEAYALLGCVVYPDLHTLVFSNLDRLVLADCFIFPTFNMLLAARDRLEIRTVACHPAPQHLVPAGLEKKLVSSNAQAAMDCASGRVDACITTLPAAQRHGLKILKDYGPVQMGFTIHMRAGMDSKATAGSVEHIGATP